MPTFGDVVRTIFTFAQPDFAIVYFAIGGFFAAFVFAISVVALPMMLDRKTDAVTAVLATIGFATLFIGIVVTIPLIGHASWHAYRDLVEAPALDPKAAQG